MKPIVKYEAPHWYQTQISPFHLSVAAVRGGKKKDESQTKPVMDLILNPVEPYIVQRWTVKPNGRRKRERE